MGLLAPCKHVLLILMTTFFYRNFSQFASHKVYRYNMTELVGKHSLHCTDTLALISYKVISIL